MLYTVRGVEDPQDRASMALALLDMLAESDSEHAGASTVLSPHMLVSFARCWIAWVR